MKNIITSLIFTLLYGCITTPQFLVDKIDEIDKDFTPNQKEAIELNNQAIHIISYNISNKDSLSKGVSLLEKAVALDSTNRLIIRGYVQYLYKNGDTEKALSLSERMVAAFPDDPYSWMMRGFVLCAEDLESSGGFECFKKAKTIFESQDDELNAMFCSVMADENKSKEHGFKSKFQEAFKKLDHKYLSDVVEDLDRVEVVKQFKYE